VSLALSHVSWLERVGQAQLGAGYEVGYGSTAETLHSSGEGRLHPSKLTVRQPHHSLAECHFWTCRGQFHVVLDRHKFELS